MHKTLPSLFALATLVVLLPLLGAALSGNAIGDLIRLPLTQRAWDPVSPSASFTLAAQALSAIVVAALVWLAWPRDTTRPASTGLPTKPSPAWGPWPRYAWLAALLSIAALIAADGAAYNAAVGLVTLAITLVLNADTERRTGASLISQRRGYFLLLFPVSLVGGWLFLYWINLFLGLWVYPHATEAVPFALGKSLDYATLLPALMSLRQWLASLPWPLRATNRGAMLATAAAPPSRQEGALLIGLAAIGLLAASVWPDTLYPLMLLAPAVGALGLQLLRGQSTAFAGAARGDWSRPLLAALAALLLMIFGQTLNLLFGGAWSYRLPSLGGISPLQLPIPAWLVVLPLSVLGLWLADQVTEPFKRRPQQPPFRPRSPVQVPLVDLLRDQKRR
jgi:hypothetical protein